MKTKEQLREEQRSRQQRYRRENREKYNASRRSYYHRTKARRSAEYYNNREKYGAKNRAYSVELKEKCLDHYGRFCACCGENNPKFLCIDHVNNDGAEHRRQIGVGGKNFYRWLVKNDFPVGFQTLCYNCNNGKRVNDGVCPHQQNSILSFVG